ncbi:hypothetical protein LPJ59_002566 [Coemansia sp. RSA 2399]|nr:hypothetical protein LPJ59_002566 [Coemansia sp. RSA 2399]KAJ1904900.1 hypothetical protein LPJ81_002222 [Coemansia sp. IMI 209127]
MKSGILAADCAFSAIAASVDDAPPIVLSSYEQAFKNSSIYKELHEVRNIRPSFHTALGLWGGIAWSGLDAMLLKGRVPFTFKHKHPDHAMLQPAAMHKPIDYPKPDDKITFDLLTSVSRTGTNHAEDQPVHLRLKDKTVEVRENLPVYDGPEQRFCPAGVYEYVDDEANPGKKRFQINAQNCIHCKTCDIKDPAQNINWTVPEGGDAMNLVALGTNSNMDKAMASGIATSEGSFSSISLDDDSGYAQDPSEQQSNRESWGLGIVLANPDQEPRIENTGMGMGGLMTTHSQGHTEQRPRPNALSLPPSRIPTRTASTKQSMPATDSASFFQRLATGITSFMSTAPESSLLDTQPKSQIEDMLVSYYLSQGRDVPCWVHDPPQDPPVTVCQRPTSIVLTNPSVPAELDAARDRSQVSLSVDPGREGSSQPGSSKSVLQSFARLNISRFTRNPFNKALQSPSASTGNMPQLAKEDSTPEPWTARSHERSRTPKFNGHKRSERTRTAKDRVFSPSPVIVQRVESSNNGSKAANDEGLEMLSTGQTPSVATRTSAKGNSRSRLAERFDTPKPMSPFSPKRYFSAERTFSGPTNTSPTPAGTPKRSARGKHTTPIATNYSPKSRGSKKGDKSPKESPKHERYPENRRHVSATPMEREEPVGETNPFAHAHVAPKDNEEPVEQNESPAIPKTPQSNPGWFKRSRTKQFLSPRLFRRSASSKAAQIESPTLEIPSVIVANSDEEAETQSHENVARENSQPSEPKTPRTGRVRSMFKRKSVHM